MWPWPLQVQLIMVGASGQAAALEHFFPPPERWEPLGGGSYVVDWRLRCGRSGCISPDLVPQQSPGRVPQHLGAQPGLLEVERGKEEKIL